MKHVRFWTVLTMLLSLAVFATGCGGRSETDKAFNIESIQSYQNIPGVTQAEITAIERLKAQRPYFSYASLNSTEALILPDGTYAGFATKLCSLFSELFGIQFVQEIYEWDELKARLDDKLIDFTGDLTSTPERMQIYSMSYAIAERSQRIYMNTDSPDLSYETELNGLRLGFLADSADAATVARFYPNLDYTIVDCLSFDDAAHKLKNHEIDAFVTAGVLDPAFDKYDYVRSKKFFPLIFEPVSLTTAKPELEPIISVVNKYLAAGGIDRLFALYNEGDEEYTVYKLSRSFNAEETAYIADLKSRGAKVNAALEFDNYPISFYNESEKEFQGIAVDVLAQISKLTGIEFETITDPDTSWSEILEMLRSGEASIVSQLIYTDARKELFLFPDTPYCYTHHALISKADYPNLAIYQVARARVGNMSQTAHEEFYNEIFPGNNNSISYATQEEAITALENGEIDLLMSSDNLLLVQTNYREKPGYKININLNFPIESKFGLNKNERVLCSIINKAQPYINTEQISGSWTSRTYDYSKQAAHERSVYLSAFVVILLMATVFMVLLLIKNRRLSKNLEGTVDERTRELNQKTANLEKRLEQQRLMASLSQNFISGGNVDSQITEALRLIGEFMGISRVLLMKIEGSSLRYLYEWDNPSQNIIPKLGTVMPLDDLERQVISALSQRTITHFNLDDIGREDIILRYKVRDVYNFMMMPVFIGDELWGALDFAQCDTYTPWTTSDINLCEMVAGVLSGAMSRQSIEDKLVEAKELAEQNSKAKSDFLSRMSHEMRTPMNAIIGMTSIGRDADDIERKDYCLGKIGSASTHLLGVINDVLDISKIEAGKFELSNTDFNLERMLIKITNVINFRIDEKKQTFAIKVDNDVPQAIISDEQRLNQVITNLLGNAVKFTPENGAISLFVRRIAQEGDLCTLQFEVRDTGIGISPEQQSKLFRSFEQADGSVTRKYGGTGLGLAISKHIVEMMGGRVWVESEVGKGSRFIFNIRAGQGSCSPPRSDAELCNLRVLAVDDDADAREFFLSAAESLKLQCDTAESGAQACDMLASRERYDVFFIDWKMDGMDGIELARRIRREYSETAAIILISGAEMSYIQSDAKQAGVDKFLSKPLFRSVIAECIHECVDSRQDETAGETAEPAELGCFEGRRILLAEDVDINREIIVSMLEPTGLQIDCAEDGKMAYEMFLSYPDYDMIFMDIHMPEVDGYTSTGMIRALDDPRARTVPIIAMTANVFREDIERCIDAGMNAHVGKPIDIEDVMSKLRQYCGTK